MNLNIFNLSWKKKVQILSWLISLEYNLYGNSKKSEQIAIFLAGGPFFGRYTFMYQNRFLPYKSKLAVKKCYVAFCVLKIVHKGNLSVEYFLQSFFCFFKIKKNFHDSPFIMALIKKLG